MSNSVGSITAGNCTFSGVSVPRVLQSERNSSTVAGANPPVVIRLDVLRNSALLDFLTDMYPRLEFGGAINDLRKISVESNDGRALHELVELLRR